MRGGVFGKEKEKVESWKTKNSPNMGSFLWLCCSAKR